ncbi:MAG: JAB domain-containing protein, partial [Puia sp.]
MELLSSAVAEIEVSYKPAKGEQPLIQSSEEANIWFRKFFSSKTISLQEQIMVLYLNRSGRAIGCYKLSVGGITAAIADVRLIFSVGLKLLATSFIIAHNHPSGNSRPSNADIALTQK